MVNMVFELGDGQVLDDIREMLLDWRRRGTCLPSFTHGSIDRAEMNQTEHDRPWLKGQDAATRFVALWRRAAAVNTTNIL